ncbi:MAG: hypothetical protein E7653_00445 [Ruminococcaceae bacterium]|nr:hypothetical protein [Oscillospiraceae bacterium]
MKRFIALLLSCVFLFLILLPPVSAEKAEVSEAEKFKNAAVFSCVYSEADKQIFIDGTVNHDVMLNHRDFTIKVYSFSADGTYEQFAQSANKVALASANMTIKFTFHFDAITTKQKYAKYALVFCSPDGEEYLVGDPLIPTVASEFEYTLGDRSAYKGILIDDPTEIDMSGAGRVIIDVDLDKAFADNSDSIIYPINDTSVYFGRTFVTDIDKKVIEAYASGASIYLRFLTRASNAKMSVAYNANDNRYTLPDLYNGQVLDMIYAASSFFAERYDGSHGLINGVVLGSKIDDVVDTNYISSISLDEYAQRYSFYLTVVANAMRTVNSKLDVVIPISDVNDYSEAVSQTREWGADELLERIVANLDSSVSGSFACTVMLQSAYVPFGISNLNIKNGIDMSKIDDSVINAHNIEGFTTYLSELSKRYSCVPTNVIYMWEQPSDLRGNALCCAYAYNFYKLYSSPVVSSFVISVDASSIDAYEGVAELVKHIDAKDNTEYSQRFAEYFGKKSWEQVLGGSVNVKSLYRLIEKEMSTTRKDGFIGEFDYIDFSNSSVINYMHKGSNTEYIRYEYDGIEKRTMKVASSTLKVGDSFGCVGIYEYSEGYAYTPTMSLRLRVDGDVDNALYEVLLIFGSGKNRIVSKGVVADNEITTLYFDADDYSAEYMADNVRISVRCLTDGSEECVLWLYELSGYSDKYDSEQLSSLIEEQRRKIRNPDDTDDDNWNRKMLITVVGVALAIIAVGAGLLMVFKNTDSKKKE